MRWAYESKCWEVKCHLQICGGYDPASHALEKLPPKGGEVCEFQGCGMVRRHYLRYTVPRVKLGQSSKGSAEVLPKIVDGGFVGPKISVPAGISFRGSWQPLSSSNQR